MALPEMSVTPLAGLLSDRPIARKPEAGFGRICILPVFYIGVGFAFIRVDSNYGSRWGT